MKRLAGIGGVAIAALIGIVGCTSQSDRGGPGAANQNVNRSYRTPDNPVVPDTNADRPIDKDDTFRVKVPALETNLKRGESKEVTIMVDRGSKFTQAVKLQFAAPTGIRISPATINLPGGEQDMKLTIAATDDAPTGKKNIDVTGIPENGKSVVVHMPVEVILE